MYTKPYTYHLSAFIVEATTGAALLLLIEQSIAASLTFGSPDVGFTGSLGFKHFRGNLRGSFFGFDDALRVGGVQNGSQHVIVPLPTCGHAANTYCKTCAGVTASLAALFNELEAYPSPVTMTRMRTQLMKLNLMPESRSEAFPLSGEFSPALADWLLSAEKRDEKWKEKIRAKMELVCHKMHPQSNAEVIVDDTGNALRFMCKDRGDPWGILTDGQLYAGGTDTFRSYGVVSPSHQLVVLTGLAELGDIAAREVGSYTPPKATR